MFNKAKKTCLVVSFLFFVGVSLHNGTSPNPRRTLNERRTIIIITVL